MKNRFVVPLSICSDVLLVASRIRLPTAWGKQSTFSMPLLFTTPPRLNGAARSLAPTSRARWFRDCKDNRSTNAPEKILVRAFNSRGLCLREIKETKKATVVLSSLSPHKPDFVALIFSLPTGLLCQYFFRKEKLELTSTCPAKSSLSCLCSVRVSWFKSALKAHSFVLNQVLLSSKNREVRTVLSTFLSRRTFRTNRINFKVFVHVLLLIRYWRREIWILFALALRRPNSQLCLVITCYQWSENL